MIGKITITQLPNKRVKDLTGKKFGEDGEEGYVKGFVKLDKHKVAH